MSPEMRGLAGRTVLPVPPAIKQALEAFAVQINEYGNGVRLPCNTCFGNSYRRAPGAACANCCTHPNLTRGYMRKANGEVQPQTMCTSCGYRRSISSHDKAPITDVCVRDNTTELRWGQEPACARCGALGTERHHWAPSAIFNDADLWPMSWLCPPCHRLWHQAMARAGGRSLPPELRIGENPWSATIGGVA